MATNVYREGHRVGSDGSGEARPVASMGPQQGIDVSRGPFSPLVIDPFFPEEAPHSP